MFFPSCPLWSIPETHWFVSEDKYIAMKCAMAEEWASDTAWHEVWCVMYSALDVVKKPSSSSSFWEPSNLQSFHLGLAWTTQWNISSIKLCTLMFRWNMSNMTTYFLLFFYLFYTILLPVLSFVMSNILVIFLDDLFLLFHFLLIFITTSLPTINLPQLLFLLILSWRGNESLWDFQECTLPLTRIQDNQYPRHRWESELCNLLKMWEQNIQNYRGKQSHPLPCVTLCTDVNICLDVLHSRHSPKHILRVGFDNILDPLQYKGISLTLLQYKDSSLTLSLLPVMLP